MRLRTLTGLLLVAMTLGAQPKRIVSAAPSLTEILYALGLGDRVVGVTAFCNYPPEAQTKPKIGSYVQPNLEAIMAMRPDLVVAVSSPIHRNEKLRSLGLPLLEVRHESITDIHSSLVTIAEAAGVAARGRELSQQIRTGLEDIRRRTRELPRRSVMFIVGRTPGRLEGIIAVGRASYLNELIAVAGGTNIFADAAAAYPKISLESVLARNPDVIIDMGEMAETAGVTEKQKQVVVGLWSRYPSLSAAKQRRVFAVASDIFVVPGPRMLEAARAFARMVHPEAGL